jgi:hypothetical protein
VANIPDWQKLYLTSGDVTVYSAGQLLTQTNLNIHGQKGDTLTMPLLVDPNITVTRRAVGDYKERVSGTKIEQTSSFEIAVKNNRAVAIELTVKDKYPISTTDEVEIQLTEALGATTDLKNGYLTWKLKLEPKAEQTLRFTYTLKRPKEGRISGI